MSTADKSVHRKVVVGTDWSGFRCWLHEQQLSPQDAIFADCEERIVGLELKEEDIVQLGPVSEAFEKLLRTRIR